MHLSISVLPATSLVALTGCAGYVKQPDVCMKGYYGYVPQGERPAVEFLFRESQYGPPQLLLDRAQLFLKKPGPGTYRPVERNRNTPYYTRQTVSHTNHSLSERLGWWRGGQLWIGA